MKQLSDKVTELKGVGPKKAVALNKLGIETIIDLLTYFPRRYDDLSLTDLVTATDGQKVTVKGTVLGEPTLIRFGRKRVRLNFQLLVNEEPYTVTFFNQPWLKKQLSAQQEIMVHGVFDQTRRSITGIKIINSTDNQFDSIYPATKEVKQSTIRTLVKLAFDEYQSIIPEIIPENLRQGLKLERFVDMIREMHFPTDPKQAQRAIRTAKFTEFLLYEMQIQQLRQAQRQNNAAAVLNGDINQLEAFIGNLPYELTQAQRRVINEIINDLKAPQEMNRLLQGDVGSGKTIVAAAAMLFACSAGKQAVIMAPTEILAEQHANKLADLFAGSSVSVSLLTGSTKPAARKLLLPRIANGEVNLVVGTHALFQSDIKYHDLGLAVIDEQHRFGVNQRTQLKNKGQATNVLSMTATPIPRTLAITTYGDMDVSIIDELPANRRPIRTTWLPTSKTKQALNFIGKQLNEGHQVYVVAPLIEESDAVDMQNATAIFERFRVIFGEHYSVGLLHGRMDNAEKDSVMQVFASGKFQLLVATTVIEVGVDVKNATTMVILDADHFGLAQLHQLRGRVGRGEQQSYCILIADPKTEIGKQRMTAVVESTDGFYLSQKDLELRGQGDLVGLKQSGAPEFKLADPVGDLNILTVAAQAARKITSEKNWQTKPENVELAMYLKMIKPNLNNM
ncbi:ATP-dependent DNA helicase RecG [Lentilactobacillus senioris]|uniref:ATP-dependent DNA helicase RecG n=1 Tax=Lentilactobacillus senioris TaxID=931534 RepID=UPI00227E9E86|nr:ATP-dependent DNA helicase RecG [Lentilactobacillus senioris]MCY9806888.1 ATP-dependent DNA helicase RecG [Lentilactobacillus senioris]